MATNELDISYQIQENEIELINAFQNCDLNKLKKLIHENALFILPNGLNLTKAMVLDNYNSGRTAMASIKA